MTDRIDDALAYLRGMVPPDCLDLPRYRDVRRQIDALTDARLALLLAEPPPPIEARLGPGTLYGDGVKMEAVASLGDFRMREFDFGDLFDPMARPRPTLRGRVAGWLRSLADRIGGSDDLDD